MGRYFGITNLLGDRAPLHVAFLLDSDGHGDWFALLHRAVVGHDLEYVVVAVLVDQGPRVADVPFGVDLERRGLVIVRRHDLVLADVGFLWSTVLVSCGDL